MNQKYRICTIILFMGLVLVSIFSVGDYGYSWDAWLSKLGARSEQGHALSFCFGLLGVLAAWRFTARIGCERVEAGRS